MRTSALKSNPDDVALVDGTVTAPDSSREEVGPCVGIFCLPEKNTIDSRLRSSLPPHCRTRHSSLEH